MKSRSRLLLCVVLLLAGLLWFTERNRRNLASTVTSPETRAATQSLIALNHAAANASDKVVIMATGDSDYVAWSTKYLSRYAAASSALSNAGLSFCCYRHSPDPNLALFRPFNAFYPSIPVSQPTTVGTTRSTARPPNPTPTFCLCPPPTLAHNPEQTTP